MRKRRGSLDAEKAILFFEDFPKDVYWFPRFAELFVKGEVWHGDYMEYHRDKLEGLKKHGDSKHILYIVYEKMKKDPREELERIATFIGGKAADKLKDQKVCPLSSPRPQLCDSLESRSYKKLKDTLYRRSERTGG